MIAPQTYLSATWEIVTFVNSVNTAMMVSMEPAEHAEQTFLRMKKVPVKIMKVFAII